MDFDVSPRKPLMETLLPRLRDPLDTGVYPEFVETSFREQLAAILDRIAPHLSGMLPELPAYANASDQCMSRCFLELALSAPRSAEPESPLG